MSLIAKKSADSLQSGSCFTEAINSDEIAVSTGLDINNNQYIISRYKDEIWDLWPFFKQSNKQPHQKRIDWKVIPLTFRSSVKAAGYSYWTTGMHGFKKPSAGSLRGLIYAWSKFLRFIHSCQVSTLADIRPIHVTNYKLHMEHEQLSSSTIKRHLDYINYLWIFRVANHDSLSFSPNDFNGLQLGHNLSNSRTNTGKTSVIPLDALMKIYSFAENVIETSEPILKDLESGKRNYGSKYGHDIFLIRDSCFF